MDETQPRRPCPFCAEDIAAAAIRCPHCRSRLAMLDAGAWRRDHPERRVAGVAAAVAHATAVPVGAVRLGFGVLTFIHFLGPMLYAIGWLMIPRTAGEPSQVEGLLDDAAAMLRRWRHGSSTPFSGGPAA
ncbi:MAG TPA: PspC domain-containing protein [Candidatus Eisenbacteria bacterium]|nr:PspC domain-containing protein [Candidatus Eisenbacteria bacterium]